MVGIMFIPFINFAKSANAKDCSQMMNRQVDQGVAMRVEAGPQAQGALQFGLLFSGKIV